MREIVDPNKCPFCGGENIEFAHDAPDVWVECHECGARGPEEETLNMAAKAWNEARQDEIERLTAENARLRAEGVEYHEVSMHVTKQMVDVVERLQAENDRLRGAIVELINTIRVYWVCPWCKGTVKNGGGYNHAPDCACDKALALMNSEAHDE